MPDTCMHFKLFILLEKVRHNLTVFVSTVETTTKMFPVPLLMGGFDLVFRDIVRS